MKTNRPKGWGLFRVTGPCDPMAFVLARLHIKHVARPVPSAELRALWPRLEQAAAKKKRIPCLVARDPGRRSVHVIYLPTWLAARHYSVPWLGAAALYCADARAALVEALLDPERHGPVRRLTSESRRIVLHFSHYEKRSECEKRHNARHQDSRRDPSRRKNPGGP